MPVNLSYPKPRDLLTKVIRIARTDSATPKAVLPKGAFVIRVTTYIDTTADAGTPTYNLGWSGASTSLLNGAVITGRGQAFPSTTSGTSLFTALDQDRELLGTFNAVGSASGSTGYVTIEYVVVGPGEGPDN